ncbi:MAG TPA: glycosyltransferase family 4 protein [Rhodopila sp.]
MKILVWQWGRIGAGPRFGACLAEALRDRPGIEVTLSLCRNAEIMLGPNPPRCEMPVRTYGGMASFILRLVTAPAALPFLLLRLRRRAPDLAICAMPGPLDLLMAVALRLLGTRLVVVVHDADGHPGDGFPLQMTLQRLLCRCAEGLAVLCGHVGTRLRQQGLAGTGARKLIRFEHPPFAFDPLMPDDRTAAEQHPQPPTEPERPHGVRPQGVRPQGVRPPEGRGARPRRLLCFGRLLPYKGLDLLARALASLPPDAEVAVRVVGSGPECPALDALRACRGVTVENRWVPETEIGSLLAGSDALILPYREASQSGVAAAALAAGRPVIATCVGGLREQLSATPHAVLCEPRAESLAGAIGQWLRAPIQVVPRVDATAAWREAVSALLLGIASSVPMRPRPGKKPIVPDLYDWVFRLPGRRSRRTTR